MSDWKERAKELAASNNHAAGVSLFLPTVTGRVLHFDGDFLAYQGAYKVELSYAGKQRFITEVIEEKRLLSGAETIKIHLTPKGSTKGNRRELAVLAEYQANRVGREKPEDLEPLRLWMAREFDAILWYDREADDGLAMVAHEATSENKEDLCIVVSLDKDINIIKGWHLDWRTGDLYYVDRLGKLYRDDKDKVRGTGAMFFWYQMICGDTADNIKGLPLITSEMQIKYLPSKKIDTLLDKLNIAKLNNKSTEKLLKQLNSIPSKTVGETSAFKLFENVKSSSEAYAIVSNLYKSYVLEHKPTHWKTGELLSFEDMFFSNAQLLWMRRNNNQDDFLDWLNEELELDAKNKK